MELSPETPTRLAIGWHDPQEERIEDSSQDDISRTILSVQDSASN
jgi:hypothetical protein